MRRHFAALLLLGLAMSGGRLDATAAALPWQHLPEGRLAAVAAVPSGDRLTLDDGTPVVLAGLRAPRDAAANGEAAEAGYAAAHAALAGLALQRTVRLYGPDGARDRHGRSIAHAVVIGTVGDPDEWLQAAMLSRGMARAYPLAGEHPALAAAMLAGEADARAAGRGLWRQADYGIRTALQPDRIPAGFQLVEGRVLAIGESANSLFLNFGTDWRQDFTAVIERRDRGGFPEGLRSLQSMQGRFVRVRGSVFRYGGPAIRVRHRYAIEVLEQEQER